MSTPSPLEQMDRILTSYCILQAVGVVARLGIADRIADRPQSVSQLALETSVNELALHRLLRMLVAMDIFNQDETGRIGLAPLGATLRSDAPGSVEIARCMSRRRRCGPSGGSSRSAWKPAGPAWSMHMAKSSILSCRTRQGSPTSSIASCRRHLRSMPRRWSTLTISRDSRPSLMSVADKDAL